MTLAEKIRKIREEKGMTQKQVAAIMGISQQAYSQYESGAREPKPETMGRIAIALGVDIHDLLNGCFSSDANEKIHYLAHSYIGQRDEQALAGRKALYEYLQESPLASDLWDSFCSLNERGKRTAIERVQELTQIPQYQLEESMKCDSQNTFVSIEKNTTNKEK